MIYLGHALTPNKPKQPHKVKQYRHDIAYPLKLLGSPYWSTVVCSNQESFIYINDTLYIYIYIYCYNPDPDSHFKGDQSVWVCD